MDNFLDKVFDIEIILGFISVGVLSVMLIYALIKKRDDKDTKKRNNILMYLGIMVLLLLMLIWWWRRSRSYNSRKKLKWLGIDALIRIF